ncbi:MAG TPA: WYL domain-containing protein, partial [Isosphaeraceae bacterium]|nr:WYL domain-containing protein [Isosphaeraceae bacterium]
SKRRKKSTRGARSEPERRERQAGRFARILKLLELLQCRTPYNAGTLAAELKTTSRTVHRDLQVLALAGVPCDYDREQGRYVLRGDYRFAVTGLTDDELLGQATASALTRAKGLDIGEGAAPTARKLHVTSRERARSLLADAQRVTAVLDLKMADHEAHRDAIRTIQWALIERKCLEGTYASPYQAGEKRLLLLPYRLCLVKQAWYLIARPEGSVHPVTYRVARFRSLKKLDAIADVPEDFDLRAYFGNAWAVYRGEREHDVEVRFVPEAAALVTETTWHHTQQIQHHEDGSVTLSFRVDGLEEIARWLLGWSGWIEVVRPAELRAMVVEQLQRALALNREG